MATTTTKVNSHYDVIIAGAGPAGLACAAELAPHVSVLVLEPGPLGSTAAAWYSYFDRVAAAGLEHAVVYRTDAIHFTSPTQEHVMLDDCVVLDGDRVLSTWLHRSRQNGASFECARLLSAHCVGRCIRVMTDRGPFHGRVLLDCTGSRSPLLTAHNLVKRKDAWVIHGARIGLSDQATYKRAKLSYFPLGDAENSYIGVHPHGDSKLDVYAFKGQANTMGDPSEMEHRFERALNELYPGAVRLKPLRGTIVSGELYRYALDRVVFFGASGMFNPDGCGMGFNEILLRSARFCRGLLALLRLNQLQETDLQLLSLNVRDSAAVHFQRMIGVFSLRFIQSPGRWDGGVSWLNAMGPDSRAWMRNEMSVEWMRRATLRLHSSISLAETLSLVPASELGVVIGHLAHAVLASTLDRCRRHSC